MSTGPGRFVESLGLPGVIGIGLLGFALAYYAAAVRPLQGELAGLQSRLDRAVASRPGGVVREAEQSPEEGIEAFYEQLAPEKSVDAVLEKITRMARDRGILLKQGRYRFSWVGERFGRYEVAFSAQTPYYQSRMFIHEVLAELPMVSMDEVSFQRQQVTAGGAEMTVTFAMLVRRER